MKLKSKFLEVFISTLGLELPEYQTKQKEDDSHECFIPACMDAVYKIVLKNTSATIVAAKILIDGRRALSSVRFISPNETVEVIGFDAGRRIEDGKVILEAQEFVFGRPQIQDGANNNVAPVRSGTIEISVHPACFLREEGSLLSLLLYFPPQYSYFTIFS